MPARLQSYSSLLKLHFCGEREHTKEDLSVLLLNLDTVPQNWTVWNLLHACQCERLWSLGVLEFMNFLCDDSLLSSECIKFLRNVLVTSVLFSLLWRVKVDCFVLFCFLAVYLWPEPLLWYSSASVTWWDTKGCWRVSPARWPSEIQRVLWYNGEWLVVSSSTCTTLSVNRSNFPPFFSFMSKNHTIRGCKDLGKKRETRNFLYVDQTIATFVCHSIRENSESEVAKLTVLLDRGSRGERKQVAEPRGEWDENNALAASTTKSPAVQAKWKKTFL